MFVFKNATSGERVIVHNDNEAVMAFMETNPFLGGFNNKHYDNHILKAVLIGVTLRIIFTMAKLVCNLVLTVQMKRKDKTSLMV